MNEKKRKIELKEEKKIVYFFFFTLLFVQCVRETEREQAEGKCRLCVSLSSSYLDKKN